MCIRSLCASGIENILISGESVFTYANVLNIHLPVMCLYIQDVEMEVRISIAWKPLHCFSIFPYSKHLHMKHKIFVWGGYMFLTIFLCFHYTFLYPVQKVLPPLGNFPQVVLGHRVENCLWAHQDPLELKLIQSLVIVCLNLSEYLCILCPFLYLISFYLQMILLCFTFWRACVAHHCLTQKPEDCLFLFCPPA